MICAHIGGLEEHRLTARPIRETPNGPFRSPYCLADVVSCASDPENLHNTAKFMIVVDYQSDPCRCACCTALTGGGDG